MRLFRACTLYLLIAILAASARAETVALALSGGGSRGFAVIGVLAALEEEGLAPDLIVGTSMGAVLGGLWASGYSATELKDLACTTDWSSLFLNSPSRRNLFLGRKEMSGRHILLVRFRGWSPELPLALSNGQKLSETLFYLAHTAPYQPWPSFDDLKIPFRAVAADLVSGQPVVFSSGDLSEAMRASISLPLVFTPYRLDSMLLVDGGIIENIPVDISREQGATAVIAVDVASDLVSDDNMTLPWELANRVTTIMHTERNARSRKSADVLIIPRIGPHRSSDFTGVPALIQAGYDATKADMPRIRSLMHPADSTRQAKRMTFCSQSIYEQFRAQTNPDSLPPCGYVFSGVRYVADSTLQRLPKGLDGIRKLDLLRRAYLDDGLVLAHATDLRLSGDRVMHVHWEEGRIRRVRTSGLRRYRPQALLREIPLHEGEIFDLKRARRGLAQSYGSDLFETVTFSVVSTDSGAYVTVRAEERQSPQLRLGAGYSSERGGRSFVELLNDNVLDLGARLAVFGKFGEQDEEARAVISADRIGVITPLDELLQSSLTTEFRAGWRREEFRRFNARHHSEGWFFFERSSAELWIGRAFRRWGELSWGARYESVRAGGVTDENSASTTLLGVRSIIDTKDTYPFPTSGIAFNGCYEFAVHSRHSGRLFNRLRGVAEAYIPLAPRLVLHGQGDYAWNDRILPLWAQFHLGGEESLLGLHYAERFGNSKLAFLGELRYDLLSRWLADAYVSGIYAIGAVSPKSDAFPQRSDYQQGVGAAFSLSTLLGPMKVTYGQVFSSRLSGSHSVVYVNLGHDF